VVVRSFVRLAGALAVLAILVGGAPAVTARDVPEYDTQWWQELDLAGSLSDPLSYLVSGFTRFSDKDPNPALTGGGGFVTYTQGAFGYSLGYLHAQVKLPSSGGKIGANLPLAALTGTLHLEQVTVADRLRIEDLIGVPGDPWRYRNLLFAGVEPGSWSPIKSWGVSDEVFIDMTSGRLSRNRLLAGPVFALSRHVELSCDYLNERDVRSLPGRIQGAFLDVTLRL
jgi:hypothetical protein